MRWLVDLLYVIAGLVYLPIALYNAIVVGKNRRGWAERFGRVSTFDPSTPRIWIHAVSLGEINATPRLVEMLRERLPLFDIVVSTTTDTGFARAVQRYSKEKVFRFPLDFSYVVQRVLRLVKPSMIVLVELEVWPNLVRLASQRGIPVVVINGRLTARSARRFARLGGLAKSMFNRLTRVFAQDESIAGRFRAVGVPSERVEIIPSLKWDSALITDHVESADCLARAVGLNSSRSTWVCGSTGPGEEGLILEAYRRLLEQQPSEQPPILVVVPRKPERFEEVARLIRQAEFPCVRRSEHPDGTNRTSAPGPLVVFGDTMGELRKFYALADVVFVGRSLVPLGGSDPMEVAALGKPIITGPHMENFEEPVEALKAAEAIRIARNSWELLEMVGTLLANGSLARSIGARAREVVRNHQGATQRTVDRLVSLLKPIDEGGKPSVP